MFKRLALSLALVTGACAPTPTPVDPPQPPAPLRLVQATIRTPSGVEPEDLVSSLSTDAPYTIACTRAADVPRIICTLDSGFPIGGPNDVYGGTLSVSAKGYVAHSERLLLTGRSMDLPDIMLEDEFKPLPRIQVRGRAFYLETGAPFVYLEGTDFNLYSRYLSGEDITPLLAQRRDAGIQMLRIFTAYDICPVVTPSCRQTIGRLLPSEHPNYYASIAPFSNLVAKYGLYIEFVGLTAGPDGKVLPTNNDKILHWNSLKAAVAPLTNVQLELINEWDHPANKIPEELYTLLHRTTAPTLSSRGSAIQDVDPKTPGWDYLTYHPATWGEYPRKPGHNGWETSVKFKLPVANNEMIRYPDSTSNLDHAYDMGLGCKFFGTPCTLHSVSGKNSTLFNNVELAAAKAMRAGMDAIPDYCQFGFYVHRSDLENAQISRGYEMVGVGPGCLIQIRH